jgi:hypothetical protein
MLPTGRRAAKTWKIVPFGSDGPWHAACTEGPQEVTTMVPSAIAIPEAPLAVFGSVLHPAGILGVLAAVVVVVAGGLCVAIATQDRAQVDRARRVRAAMLRTLRAIRLGGEREDAAAA